MQQTMCRAIVIAHDGKISEEVERKWKSSFRIQDAQVLRSCLNLQLVATLSDGTYAAYNESSCRITSRTSSLPKNSESLISERGRKKMHSCLKTPFLADNLVKGVVCALSGVIVLKVCG